MRAYLVGLLVPLIAAVLMNRVFGVGGLSETAKVTAYAKRQREHESIVSPAPVDHRAWVRTRLLESERCPDVLVSGSSTAGALSADMFPNHSTRNAWIGGPSVEDFEALTGVLRQMSCRPKAIVLGVDPWWIGNPAFTEVRWMAWSDDYLKFHADAGPTLALSVHARVYWASFEDDLAYTTTRQSLDLVAAGLSGFQDHLQIREGTPEDICSHVPPNRVYYARAFDGHFEKCPMPSDGERQTIARNYLRSNMHLMGTWKDFASHRIDQFSALVKEWTAMGSYVILVAPPYNPITYQLLESESRTHTLLSTLDDRLNALVEQHVMFVNLRDPALAGCEESEFVDSHHARRECAMKVANALQVRVRALQ